MLNDAGRIAAVLWDLDGTIVDTEPLWFAAEHDLAHRHGAEWSEQDSLHLIGSDLLDAGRYIRQRTGLSISAEQVVDELVGEMARRLHGPVDWRPGALALLADLRRQRIPTALVTMSYRAIVEPLLAKLPADTFDAVIVGDEIARGKPDPLPYSEAARRLGVEPADCVAIEDSATGAASARAAGCRVIVVPNQVAVPEAAGQTQIPSLEGLSTADLGLATVR